MMDLVDRAKSQRARRQSKTERSGIAEGSQGSHGLQHSPTFSNGDLEKCFVAYCQLQHGASSTGLGSHVQSLQSKVRRFEYIGNPLFESPDAEAMILGSQLFMTPQVPSKKNSALDQLPAHLARICEAKLLSPDAEKSLFLRMNYLRYLAERLRQKIGFEHFSSNDWIRFESLLAAADWHRDRIVEANMRLVISIVKKFSNDQISFDELLSDGTMALLKAVEKFDVHLGFRFSTYTTQVVRRNAYRATLTRQRELTRFPVNGEESFDEISDTERQPRMDEHRWQELRNRLGELLNRLDRREKLIVRARFSLGGHRRVQTLQRLAEALGVSKERIRQLEKRALDKLRCLAQHPLHPTSEMFDAIA